MNIAAKIWLSMLTMALIITLGYYMWKLQRRIHFQWGYKPMVEQIIRDMVKPEALK